MKEVLKYLLLLMLALPFAALLFDALGKTKHLTLRSVLFVTVASTVILFVVGGLHQRPRVANIFAFTLFLWPVALITAKCINPNLTWRIMWLTVPLMSWYVVHTSMQFYYPTNAGGGGFGYVVGLITGWAYMLIPFSVLSGAIVGIQYMRRRFGSSEKSVISKGKKDK